MVGRTPVAEVELDEELVRALLADQHPDLAELPLRAVASGWDNALFRLGDDLVVRLPRRALAAPAVAHELRWLPELAAGLPLPVPAPVRAGAPGRGYPWAWTVVPWFPGRAALEEPPADLAAAATVLGSFVAALHRPAPADAPANPWRGVPLEARRASVQRDAELAAPLLDVPPVLERWEDLAATPPWTGPPIWLHGDLHPRNLLVHRGALSAVLDFGDLTAGDPATDLGVAWMLLPPEHRPAFRAACGGGPLGPVDDATWRRGRGWALTIGLALVASSADDPAFARLGRATVAAALADDDA